LGDVLLSVSVDVVVLEGVEEVSPEAEETEQSILLTANVPCVEDMAVYPLFGTPVQLYVPFGTSIVLLA
jgi:hypothetical protein